jgi:hypothetical protein
VQVVAFCVDEKLFEQLAHTRSLVLVPTVCTYVPAAQLDQSVHVAAFCVVLYMPAPHVTQVRSVVVLPADCTCCPAAQVVFGTHGVAGSASSSQVDAEQTTSWACPPAQ